MLNAQCKYTVAERARVDIAWVQGIDRERTNRKAIRQRGVQHSPAFTSIHAPGYATIVYVHSALRIDREGIAVA